MMIPASIWQQNEVMRGDQLVASFLFGEPT
jgi:hypothetical protein